MVSKEILTGPKGGQYYINEKGKKVYIKKSPKSTGLASTNSSNKKIGRNNNRGNSSEKFKEPTILSKNDVKKRHCCICGKELSVSDINYYDLTDYCPRCALADGIITSLD